MNPSDFSTLFELLPIGAYRSSPDGLQLRANPALVRMNGYESEAELLAAVQDIGREWYVDPLQRRRFLDLMEADGRVVNFRSEVGTLDSGGRFLVTNSQGEARDELTVTAADLQNIGGNSFEVTAEVGGNGGSIISRTFSVSITRPPQASFTFQVVGNTVTFTDTSTGGPTGWTWSFGDSTPVSTQRNPVHTYSSPGSYVVTLTARNSIGSDTASNVVQINQ